MFGVPDPMIAKSIGKHCKLNRGLHSLTGGGAGKNWRQIEQGQRTRHERSFHRTCFHVWILCKRRQIDRPCFSQFGD
jgi:hypothetical protein